MSLNVVYEEFKIQNEEFNEQNEEFSDDNPDWVTVILLWMEFTLEFMEFKSDWSSPWRLVRLFITTPCVIFWEDSPDSRDCVFACSDWDVVWSDCISGLKMR